MLLRRYVHVFASLSSLVTVDAVGYHSDLHEAVEPVGRSSIVRAEARSHDHQGPHAANASAVEIMGAGAINRKKDGVPSALAPTHDQLVVSLLAGHSMPWWDKDCKWSNWETWIPFACPVTCGMSKRGRKRVKIHNKAGNGRECDDPDLAYYEEACGQQDCPIDCAWKDWGVWTGCSKSCAGGTQQRVRDKFHVQAQKGKDCVGAFDEIGNCNVDPCPVDCITNEWQEWNACTEGCGGGKRSRIKEITRPDEHGGKVCPMTVENGTCNEAACPIKAGARPYAEVSTLAAMLLVVCVMRSQAKEDIH